MTGLAGLVLCRDPAAVVSVLRALRKVGVDADVLVHGSAQAPHSRYMGRVFRADPHQALEELAEAAVSLDRSHDYRFVLVTSEPWAFALDTLGSADALRRKALLAPHGALDIARSHRRTADAARRSGLKTAPSRLIPKGVIADPPMDFPFIMRCTDAVVHGRHGLGMPDAMTCSGITAYENFLENWGTCGETEILPVPQGRRRELLCLCSKGEIQLAFAF